MKKILHVLWSGAHGEVQTYVKKLISETQGKGFYHTVFFLTKEGDAINRLQYPDVDIISGYCFSITQLDYCSHRLNQVIEEWGIDIVHCHTNSLFFLGQLPKLKKCKLIVSDHRASLSSKLSLQSYKNILGLISECIDVFLFESDVAANDFIDQLPHLESKCLTVNPYISLTDQSSRPISRVKSVGFCGELKCGAAIELFMCIAAELHAAEGQFEFHVYGKGEDSEHFLCLSHHLGLQTTIFFHDSIDDVSFEKLDVLANLDNTVENYSYSLNAMAQGIPVMAFQDSYYHDLIDSQVNGNLMMENDLAGYAENILLLLVFEEKWQAYSCAAKSFIASQFNFELHASELQNLYSMDYVKGVFKAHEFTLKECS